MHTHISSRTHTPPTLHWSLHHPPRTHHCLGPLQCVGWPCGEGGRGRTLIRKLVIECLQVTALSDCNWTIMIEHCISIFKHCTTPTLAGTGKKDEKHTRHCKWLNYIARAVSCCARHEYSQGPLFTASEAPSLKSGKQIWRPLISDSCCIISNSPVRYSGVLKTDWIFQRRSGSFPWLMLGVAFTYSVDF